MKNLVRLALAALISTGSFSAQAADLTGAGSSFAQPVISKWADAYAKSNGSRINYQSIGSAAGIKQIEAKTVDFGASDAPMMPSELDAAGLVQFPIIIGGIVPVINVPGITAGQMKLTGPVLADIYLGKLTKWNDPEIASLNPGLKLPDTAIAVVRRADGSGTTFNFTNYLSKVSPDWKSKVGEGTTVSWPIGTGGKGNEGVSLYVQRLQGAIGYVEFAYAKQSNMDFVLVQNSSGNYPTPDEKSFQAAVAGADWEKNRYYVVITNQSGKDAWPISASTFVMLQKTPEKPAQAAEVLKFFQWAFNNGQSLAAGLDYVPLPPMLVKSINDSWTRDVKDSSGKPLSLK
jgi:phosphate transport system substrate-binding protein